VTYIDLNRRHLSVCSYKPDPPSRETIEAIIGVAQQASTSSNLQTYRVVAVANRERRADLASLCGNQAFIAQAPLFLAWCADLSRLDRACEMRGCVHITRHVENILIAVMDAAIVAQTAALAAGALGLGICYIGAIRNDPEGVIRMLRLPRLVFPVTGMTMGGPAMEPAPKPRIPLSSLLHWEAYDRQTEDPDLLGYDQTMIATGIYWGRRVPVPDKTEIMEDYAWREHSARRVSQPARAGLRKVLQDQGFELE
jgi:FMN reductase (NADPH)